jgi:hypothetical protein
MALTAGVPQCNGGKLCANINNGGDTDVTVTVDIFVCDEHLKQENVTVPAHGSVQVCVQPKTAGQCVASVQVAGQELSHRIITSPCPAS